MKREMKFDYESYDASHPLPEQDRQLVEAAERATRDSYAPYSHFRVGAAARLASGRVVSGSNIESEVFPLGAVCRADASLPRGGHAMRGMRSRPWR